MKRTIRGLELHVARHRAIGRIESDFAGSHPLLYSSKAEVDGLGLYLFGAVEEVDDQARLYCYFAGNDHCLLFGHK